jgi:hypothetical protein
MTPPRTHCLGAETVARGRPGIRRRVCGGHSKCYAIATCVHDPGHCERLDGRRPSSSTPGCGSSAAVLHGIPAGRTRAVEKTFRRVTTRRRNLWFLRCLGRGLGALAAHALSLRMVSFGLGIQATFGLPPRRLPTADFTLAFRILAVTLVPTSRLVLPSAAFAQTNPRTRAARTGTTMALCFIVRGAHGSDASQGTARGERTNVLPGRLSEFKTRATIASLPLPE